MEDREQRIAQILNDREHGSRWLVREALLLVRDLARETMSSQDEQMRQVFTTAQKLAKGRPAMAALSGAMGRVVHVQGGPPAIAQQAETLLGDYDTAPKHIVEHIPGLVDLKRVMTCSISGTVLDAFSSFPHLQEAITLEGRPRYEGRAMAEALAQKGFAVTLITDAEADIFLPRCDAVIVGADTVLGDGGVLNKAGTALLGWAARGHDRPFYVLCETLKISPKSWSEQDEHAREALLEEKEPEEVLDHPIPGVRVRNFYFDYTPHQLISYLVTERGVLDQNAIKKIAEQVKEDEQVLAKGYTSG